MLQSLKAMTVEDVWISVAVWTVVIVLAATSVAFLVSWRIWVLTVFLTTGSVRAPPAETRQRNPTRELRSTILCYLSFGDRALRSPLWLRSPGRLHLGRGFFLDLEPRR